MQKATAILFLAFAVTEIDVVFGELNWESGAGGVQWARACDFFNHDLRSAKVLSEKCGETCIGTSGCTHFAWTNYQGGTCWMKSGGAQKSDAIQNTNTGMICGILAASNPIGGTFAGYWWQTWNTPSTPPPADINVGFCFSGYIAPNDVLRECSQLKAKLPGTKKFLTFGGGDTTGRWTLSALINLDNAIRSKQLSGWDGIAYDVEEGDAGLAGAFSTSFSNAKANGLIVLVTVSRAQPYGISDGPALMKSFFTNSNIDYLSPQLYTSGSESGNQYDTAPGTTWNQFASSRAKFVPSVVLGSRDFPTASNYFSQYGIVVAGYVQWSNSISNGGGCQPDYYNQCTSNGQCCSNFCDNNSGAWALGVCKPR